MICLIGFHGQQYQMLCLGQYIFQLQTFLLQVLLVLFVFYPQLQLMQVLLSGFIKSQTDNHTECDAGLEKKCLLYIIFSNILSRVLKRLIGLQLSGNIFSLFL